MNLSLPDRVVLKAIINLRVNGNFAVVLSWLREELARSGEAISSSKDVFSLTKSAGAVSLLAELVRILSDAEDLVGLQKEEDTV